MSLPLLMLVAIAIVGTAIRFFIKIKKQKKAQQCADVAIEKYITDCFPLNISIAQLAKHSDKEIVAEMVAQSLKNYILAKPGKASLRKVFHNLSLFCVSINEWTTREIELSALIQQYFLRKIDPDEWRMHKEFFQDFEEFKRIYFEKFTGMKIIEN